VLGKKHNAADAERERVASQVKLSRAARTTLIHTSSLAGMSSAPASIWHGKKRISEFDGLAGHVIHEELLAKACGRGEVRFAAQFP